MKQALQSHLVATGRRNIPFKSMGTMTQLTKEILEGKREPKIYMWNGKPFRTAAQKAASKKVQRKGNGGNWYSSAPRTLHPRPYP